MVIREHSPQSALSTLTVAIGAIDLLRDQSDIPVEVTTIAERAVIRLLDLAQQIDWGPIDLTDARRRRNRAGEDLP